MIELRRQYALAALLRVAQLSRSTFYYQAKVLEAGDRHADLKARIRALFEHHKGRYGYRRITAALRQAGQPGPEVLGEAQEVPLLPWRLCPSSQPAGSAVPG